MFSSGLSSLISRLIARVALHASHNEEVMQCKIVVYLSLYYELFLHGN